LAGDLRREVLQLMQSGKTDAEIVAFLVARYGDFVLYRPPLKPATVLLWVGPFGLLLLGLIMVGLRLRHRSAPAAVAPDAGQLAKLRAVAREGNPR
jgi:cytochrome c-type biogenesis protein CcmH